MLMESFLVSMLIFGFRQRTLRLLVTSTLGALERSLIPLLLPPATLPRAFAFNIVAVHLLDLQPCATGPAISTSFPSYILVQSWRSAAARPGTSPTSASSSTWLIGQDHNSTTTSVLSASTSSVSSPIGTTTSSSSEWSLPSASGANNVESSSFDDSKTLVPVKVSRLEVLYDLFG